MRLRSIHLLLLVRLANLSPIAAETYLGSCR